MTREKLDPVIAALSRPIVAPLHALGVSPNHLTLSGALFSGAGAWMIGAGRMRSGMLVLAFTWLFDVLDGALAKYSGNSTRFGGVLDSVVDRYTEGAVFVAFAYYYAAAGNAVMAAVTTFALTGAAAVSYARSRAENEISGKCDVGIGSRMPRLVIIAAATLAGYPGSGIIAVLLISHYTVAQRIIYTRKVLRGKAPGGDK